MGANDGGRQSHACANWLGAGQLVRLYGNYGTQDSVDISRLMFRAGAL